VGGIKIGLARAEFDKLDPAEETDLLPGDGGYDQIYNPAMGTLGGSARFPVLAMASFRPNDRSSAATHDSVPMGEVDVRRGEPVFATDGEIGKIQPACTAQSFATRTTCDNSSAPRHSFWKQRINASEVAGLVPVGTLISRRLFAPL
jgi:hypothetical protein